MCCVALSLQTISLQRPIHRVTPGAAEDLAVVVTDARRPPTNRDTGCGLHADGRLPLGDAEVARRTLELARRVPDRSHVLQMVVAGDFGIDSLEVKDMRCHAWREDLGDVGVKLDVAEGTVVDHGAVGGVGAGYAVVCDLFNNALELWGRW
jgi:hypothetical protein